jgi:hypothetical protein
VQILDVSGLRLTGVGGGGLLVERERAIQVAAGSAT